MTQPAVTFQVKQLEEEFNTRLFDRGHGRVSLTAAGELVMAYAERILGLSDEMEMRVSELTDELSGVLQLGVSTTIGAYWLPWLIEGFKRRYPRVVPRVSVGNSQLVESRVMDRNLDVGLIEIVTDEPTLERREAGRTVAQPCWLGVVDIDHFKKINDNFGHLFGDEVLLRIADLMRQTFRSNDKLFRFGGEEFVVMLRNVAEDHVHNIFTRFRLAVERHDFPQVGRVACSVGFARIDPRLSPADLLGRADEALYFSKRNGRNQVNGFDELVMSGKLRITTPASQALIQSDVDEIFL